ncbi:MAG: hypothetical protein Q7R44_00565 [bacterium]|nr:hypothetical protein [bacterium]
MKHNRKQRGRATPKLLAEGGFVEIILVIVAILAIAGVVALWYFSKNNSSAVDNSLPSQKITPNTASPNPASSDSSSAALDAELDAIVVEDPSLYFKEIDNDLINL